MANKMNGVHMSPQKLLMAANAENAQLRQRVNEMGQLLWALAKSKGTLMEGAIEPIIKKFEVKIDESDLQDAGHGAQMIIEPDTENKCVNIIVWRENKN